MRLFALLKNPDGFMDLSIFGGLCLKRRMLIKEY